MDPKHVPMSKWGKDHWSTFLYIESRCVDYKGIPDREHMRCDADRHPGLIGFRTSHGNRKYPTLLKGHEQLADHDDWDCADDAEREGLLTVHGTGIQPVYRLTDLGRQVAAALRAHKANGGNFAQFQWPVTTEARGE